MNTEKYITDVRARIDDDPTGIAGFHSDAQLLVFINNARRKINNELSVYENQHFIFPELNIDEYALETDYVKYESVIDCRVNGTELRPMPKPLVEMEKNLYFNTTNFNTNLGYINERRRVITLSNLPTSSDVEPTYNIKTFSRSGKTIVVDGVSTGVLSQISKWSSVKGYIKAIDASGNIEYMRVSKIEANTGATEYTLYISSFDLKGIYKNGTQIIGTVSSTNGDATVTGTGTDFTFDCAVGDKVTFNSHTYTILSITSATSMEVSPTPSTAEETVTGKTCVIDNRPVFADNDTIQFATLVFNYVSVPKELEMYNENDQLPLEAQELVPILTSVECGMRESRQDIVNTNYNEYIRELERIRTKLNIDKTKQINKSLQDGYL